MSTSPAHAYALSLIEAQKNTLPGPPRSCTSALISQEPGAPVYQGPDGRWPSVPRCRALTSLQMSDCGPPGGSLATCSSLAGHGEQLVISCCLAPSSPPGSPSCSSACFPVNLVARPRDCFFFFHEEEEGYKVAKVGLTVKQPELLSCTWLLASHLATVCLCLHLWSEMAERSYCVPAQRRWWELKMGTHCCRDYTQAGCLGLALGPRSWPWHQCSNLKIGCHMVPFSELLWGWSERTCIQ